SLSGASSAAGRRGRLSSRCGGGAYARAGAGNRSGRDALPVSARFIPSLCVTARGLARRSNKRNAASHRESHFGICDALSVGLSFRRISDGRAGAQAPGSPAVADVAALAGGLSLAGPLAPQPARQPASGGPGGPSLRVIAAIRGTTGDAPGN